MNVSINRNLLTRSLVAVVLILVILNVLVVLLVHSRRFHGPVVYELFQKFYFDSKHNLPSFFNTFLLLMASLILYHIYLVKKKKFQLQRRWLVLAVLFLFMAVEENASVHVFVRSFLPHQSVLRQTDLSVLLWGIPFGLLVAILGMYFKRLVSDLPRKIATGFVLAAVIYITGAIVLDLAGSVIAYETSKRNFLYIATATLEESLEMAGIIVFIHHLLGYIKADLDTIELGVG